MQSQVDIDEATVVGRLSDYIASQAVPKGAVDIGAAEKEIFKSHLKEARDSCAAIAAMARDLELSGQGLDLAIRHQLAMCGLGLGNPAYWAAYVTGKASAFRLSLWAHCRPWNATPVLLHAAIKQAALAFENEVTRMGGKVSVVLPGTGHITHRHGPRAVVKWSIEDLKQLGECGWMTPLKALVEQQQAAAAAAVTPAMVEGAVLASGRGLQGTGIMCGNVKWYRTDDPSSYNCAWLGLRFLLLAGVVVLADAQTTLVDGVLRCGVQTGWKKPRVHGGSVGAAEEEEMPVPDKGHSGSRTQALFEKIGSGLFKWLKKHELAAVNLLVFSIVLCFEVKMQS